MEGRGVHEVVIENPDHALELGDLPVAHIRDVLRVFQLRIRAIECDLHYQYVQIFKNKGKEAGASLSHPHSQIVATPIIPKTGEGGDLRRRPAVPGVQGVRVLPDPPRRGGGRNADHRQERAFHGFRAVRLALPVRDGRLPEAPFGLLHGRPGGRAPGAGRDAEARPDPAQGDRQRSALQHGPPPGPEPGPVARRAGRRST